MDIAIALWKKAIELHQNYGCAHQNYNVEEYANEIKKIDPNYIIPEKTEENIREKKAREEAEAKERKDREQAEAKARKEKEKKKRYIIGVIIAAAVILIAVLPNLLSK